MKKAQAKAKKHIYSSGLAGCGGKSEPTNAKNAGQPIFCPFCDRIFKQDGRFKDHLKSKHPEDVATSSQNKTPTATESSSEVRPDGKIAYHVKTPKTLLSEWCQKNKCPTPRYKHVEVEGGFHCRLVLPDVRDSEKDTIFWFRESACSSAQDAQNRVAVMGLHWVMGDRRMDRVLEEQYQQQWKYLNVAMEERKERERRQQQQPKKRLGPQKELQAVFMSEHSRRLVEGLIHGEGTSTAELDHGAFLSFDSEGNGDKEVQIREEDTGDRDMEGHGWDTDSNGDKWDMPSSQAESDDADAQKLSAASFSEEDKLNAHVDLSGITKAATLNKILSSKAGSSVEAQSAIESPNTRSSTQGTSERTNADRQVRESKSENMWSELKNLGFQDKDIRRALETPGTIASALDWLVLHVAEADLPPAFAPDASMASIKVAKRGEQRQGEGFSGDRNKQVTLRLCQSGYSASDVRSALFASSGDEVSALCKLFKDLATEQHDTADARNRDKDWLTSSRTAKELAEMREEEWMAIKAIYGEDVLEMTDSYLTLRLPWERPEELLLEVHIHPQSFYPLELPALRFKGKDFSTFFFRSLTEKTASHAWELVGQSMVYELACFASEIASSLYQQTSRQQLAKGSTSNVFHGKIGGYSINGRASNLHESNNSHIHTKKQAGVYADSERKDKLVAQTFTRNSVNSTVNSTHASVTPRLQSKIQEEGSVDATRAESLRLFDDWKRWQKDGKFASMRECRSRLPAFRERLKLLENIKNSSVVIVSGQTGCGKSTQVPQYVLEEAIENSSGGSCNIICTQPRRISAIGVAERVAQERGEAAGLTVGYAIRLDSKQSQRTRLLFCTTGILLRRLQADPDLVGVTHVIVDEVHERSLDSDLLLLLLRDVLRRNIQTRPASQKLRVILMSATVDAALFAEYFATGGGSQPPVVNIPGFTHPVRELYLEDAFELTGYRVSKNSKYALKKPKGPPASGSMQNSTPEWNSVRNVGHIPDSWEGQEATLSRRSGEAGPMAYSESTSQSVAVVDEDMLNYELMEAVVYKIMLEAKEPSPIYGHLAAHFGGDLSDVSPVGKLSLSERFGAILVFLPGVAEIRRLQNVLQSSRRIADLRGNRGPWILPLHGSLTGDEQRRVFSQPPPGVQKVVLATNIAETSITIDDVVYVIDSGRLKEMRYEHSRGMACLVDAWVSKASAGQRRGRAGRVRPGCCIRLFSRKKFSQMAQQQEPEMLRVPLDNLCLQVKSILPGPLKSKLGQALTPPSPEAVDVALRTLVDLQALSVPEEELTPLGCHLAKMPVNPHLGKMLIFGCLLRCLDPILTIAAAISNRPPFLSPMDRRNEANEAKRSFGGSSKSDHFAVVNAYNGWREARKEGREAERMFCDTMFLSHDSLVTMELSRVDYTKVLVDLGFVSDDYYRSMKTTARLELGLTSLQILDTNSRNIRIVKAVLCAGLYPHVVRVQHPETTYAQHHGGTAAKDAAAHEVKFYTKDDGRVFLHPASINFVTGKFESGWLIYGEKVKTSKVFIRECTMVPAYALLLFGGEIHVEHLKQVLRVDNWMDFQAPARIAVLVRELRTRVDDALAVKINNASLDISVLPVVEALVHLLTTDGF